MKSANIPERGKKKLVNNWQVQVIFRMLRAVNPILLGTKK